MKTLSIEGRRWFYLQGRPLRLVLGLCLLILCGSAPSGDDPGARADSTGRDAKTSSIDAEHNAAKPVVPDYLKLEKSWNIGSHCGPNALYVLCNLSGVDVSLEEVVRQVPIDPESGCSLADLQTAAGELGLSGEVRFVDAEALQRVPRPFILHLAATQSRPETGHFVTVFDYEQGRERNRFGLIDGTSGEIKYVNPENFFRSFSGYVLVPMGTTTTWPFQVLRVSVTSVALVILALAASLFWRQRKPAAFPPGQLVDEKEGSQSVG